MSAYRDNNQGIAFVYPTKNGMRHMNAQQIPLALIQEKLDLIEKLRHKLKEMQKELDQITRKKK